MATLQSRRGVRTATQSTLEKFVGTPGEITIRLENLDGNDNNFIDVLVHDGSTAGGIRLVDGDDTAELATAVIIIAGLQIIVMLNGRAPWITISLGSMAFANLAFDIDMILHLYPTDMIDILFDISTVIVIIAFYKIAKKCSVMHNRRWDDKENG